MNGTATVTVTVAGDAGGRYLLAPVGIQTPETTPLGFAVEGADFRLTGESETGQMAALIAPAREPVILTYAVADGPGPGYPEALFAPRDNRFTRPAAALADDARNLAETAGGGAAGIAAIVNHVGQKFRYAHPEVRFNDGADAVPHLACGLTEGSCVDINTYLIACLRAAGYEAGYVTGYFFPAEKNGTCDDMHCWVVTRHGGRVEAWDIAHHLKLGTRTVQPGLNPKPGTRVAVGHSMGLTFPALGIADLKLLAEPVWVDAEGGTAAAEVTIRLERSEVLARTG
ncbi:transglutaminase-like domain-containing protein [Bauldia sp.]|uniref:transglutaminase-like domain-containing protein n=1 Tax=Bauldia sp. TaxID=2575872 RepID=UPI003BABEDEA